MAKETTALEFKHAIQRRLAEYREHADMSQADLAEFLGITKDRYSKWETRSTIPAEFMPSVCVRLGITAWFLLTGRLIEEHMKRAGEPQPQPQRIRPIRVKKRRSGLKLVHSTVGRDRK